MNAPNAAGVYLEAYLEPLRPWLARADVTDILVNAPEEVWIESIHGGMERHAAPGLTATALARLAAQIAALTHQGVNRENPLLAATLPDGARVQIVAPPATRRDLALAIRKHVVNDFSLDDYARAGAFAETRRGDSARSLDADRSMAALLEANDVMAFLRAAVRHRKNIIVSGGTSTGKTTFLNALLKAIPREERLIVIEDTPEVRIEQPNAVGMVAARGVLGEARVGVEDLLQASLRLRPDRIILGELRGPEAFSFLRAVNSGHPGSITTVHADNPDSAMNQIALMVLQSGANMSRSEIIDYVTGVVQVAVQLGRRDGKRTVTDIVFRP
ncbi:MAG: P-type DNA transfer ATPase VirB11 [Phycisphaerales bacterium]|nr:P-type DNA transfer ATPase VirB11 [Hyphomonadaceae bacterium]